MTSTDAVPTGTPPLTTDSSSGTPPAYPMPKASGCPMDPPPVYRTLRAEQPVSKARLYNGREAWLISRHEDVRKILSDSRASVDALNPGFPWLSEVAKAMNTAEGGVRPLGRMDPPDHTELRRMLAPHFLIKRVRALRPATEELVDGLIDRMLEGPSPADLVPALARPVPSTVVGWLLGVPAEAMARFGETTAQLFDEDGSAETAVAARGELFEQLKELVELRRAEPDGNIVSRLVGFADEGRLTETNLLMQIGLLLGAGYDTTVKMITTGVLALLGHPEQAALLAKEPERAAGATEELLRYLTVAEFAPKRVAVEEIEIGGQTIRPGDGIICLISSADRDESVYERPDELDIERSARDHLAFGSGIHLCVGHSVARMELEVVYGRLFSRIPQLRLAVAPNEIPFSRGLDVQGAKSLPVTW
ncbi:cytochrome P450 [Streptomyces populi]|uniref:Cytochrome P450 n=1 Tax=Streptomyces populi TaxID=2058924 RepID=A0A2I0SCC7_9ACTN|nr:cytochrome P450 [Streptomyces populi]PKT67608.1 cytochrome P450 [Streptomyces populi]